MKTQKLSHVLFTFFLLLTMVGTTFAMAFPQRAGTLSYIVQATDVERASELVDQVGGLVTARLEIIDGVAATLSAGALAQLRTMPEVVRLTPNAQVEAAGNKIPATDYPNVIGADVVWAEGVTGELRSRSLTLAWQIIPALKIALLPG
jgi:hypothetical protein